MGIGKELRLRRIFDANRRTVIIPMDQGEGGFYSELIDPRGIVKGLVRAAPNAFLFHRGLARFVKSEFVGKAGFIMRVTGASGLSTRPTEHIITSAVQTAVRYGADAVAATVFVGSQSERMDLRRFGILSDACEEWGVPLVGEMIPQGGKNAKPYDGPYTTKELQIAVRVGAEYGADFIKTTYSGSTESFRQVVEYSYVPVVIAGGPKTNTVGDVLKMVKGAVDAGAAGICMGRKMWGYQDPPKLVKAACKIVRENSSLSEAMKCLS